MARVLVTGASGFIGSHVAHALSAGGHDVLAIGRNRSRLAVFAGTPIAVDTADIASDPLGNLVASRHAVVHCAALSSPWGPREAFQRANVQATRRLLEAADQAGVERFVHLSSPSIYFRLADQFDIPEAFVPPRRWINAYAESKWQSEQCVADARYARMSRVVLRPRAVFGEGDQAIFPRILRVANRGWFPQIGDGRVLIDTTYVGNVADAAAAALVSPRHAEPQVFNITNGEPMPVRELLDRLFASLDMKVRTVRLPRRAAVMLGALAEGAARLRPGQPEPRLSRYGVGVLGYAQTLDISHARRVLGYRPRVSIDEGIRRFSQWWSTHDAH
ncbi:NAD(P)-dependent oxidoreductase [Rhodanobacter sp. DHB23]|uniref:NAD-dependent epimerase/dehydratase family protein n=1 Tax=Rhodanobacter sp. DHB23 TaxID=2775923 RepID=UPI0017800089|nr:NAD(P)-dependent oxidoreductase [Rhodanobacter sp. DHB23]MBD8871312.1 NAD(P)-dependent oxidoreductase [Rhodanobacter sp. DHB23]